MKKIIRLTESELTRIVKQVIIESQKKPPVTKVVRKIEDILRDIDISFSGLNRRYKLHHLFFDDPKLYTFKVTFYDLGHDIEKIAKKVIDELNDEFGYGLFELIKTYDRHFLIRFFR